MDLEKYISKDDGSAPVSESASASSSEPSLLKPKPFDLKPNRDILPEKKGTKLTRYLKFNFFTTYRKIFTVIFTSNLIAFVCFIAKAHGVPLPTDIASASSANLMVAILFRQENFVNLVYELAVCVPHSLPVSIRRRLAKVFHYGGAHSGSGTAAVVWFLLYSALITRDYIHAPTKDALANLITSYICITMFLLILGAAHPRFRVKFHDYFEAGHRFAGWTALITFWIHNGLAAKTSAREQGIPIGLFLVKSPNFWFFCVSTSCTLLSWSRLRHREVYPEVLSDHAIRLHFKYRAMQPFYGLKVSNRPMLEWHAFATIPDEDENGKINGFSVVVSNAGDWTKQTIMNPPTKLWVRGYPLHGLLYTSRLFKRIVVVATGSGIGPCLSLLYANVTPRRVLWSTPHPETTYGPKIMNSVLKADPDAIVWNTRTLGRPDMVALTYQLVLESNAEAVFIISNPKVTRKVVYGMETRGIPAYGAIFDS
ncbi:hypothetical protein GALMADRAFT_143674 [Galerina marginata CBS 339.88]|uniref:AMP-dependent synthetase/ligase domain-containing protein n=1 Tax=Galerina marginata (strain CBS 339.88) TaxID=685588 RepID=A0A067SLV6_GALM3|nr:hypothetical protein GALMADRAFT_143674 [Galerina marginata CBS 339.88]